MYVVQSEIRDKERVVHHNLGQTCREIDDPQAMSCDSQVVNSEEHLRKTMDVVADGQSKKSSRTHKITQQASISIGGVDTHFYHLSLHNTLLCISRIYLYVHFCCSLCLFV
ncbi:hypothetical protein ATANTOWER_012083 [Ataeniobius toweri]|uniref:Uncharacterized protein n=1 Tax=Ataeniobius toweri TaxID=208326 RepID=A0ABU7AZZ9_9TELE|nr:hypothetical protein [Ataeniobius toweri]